jgi:hypothetical protein
MPKETTKQENKESPKKEPIPTPKFDLERCLKKRDSLITHLKHMIDYNKKNKALLSFKYDHISSKINFVQVSVIIISTAITFIETIKAKYSFDETAQTMLPIIFSTYIALVLAIVRFFKLDEKKEEVSKTIQNFTFLINKFRKTLNSVIIYEIEEGTYEGWRSLISNYETETYDFYITTRESFDNIMPFKDLIYYKTKFRREFLEHAFVTKDIKMIEDNKKMKHTKYNTRESMFTYICKSIFCCKKRRILFDDFIQDAENLLNENKESVDTAIQTDNNIFEEQNQEVLDLGNGLKTQTI